MKYIVPRRDYRLLKWLEPFGSRGVGIDRYAEVLSNDGRTEIEIGQFLNEYTTKGIIVRIPDGRIKIRHALSSNVKYDYDVREQ